MKCSSFSPIVALLTLCALGILAYEVSISEADNARQFCSGMWSGKDTYINVSFADESQGHVAMVIYEWSDVAFLGKVASTTDDSLPKIYVCTSDAVRQNFCTSQELGQFITDLPPGKPLNTTSIWTLSIELSNYTQQSQLQKISSPSSTFWDNPAGNPVLPVDPSSNNSPPFGRSVLDNPLRRQNGVQDPLHYSTPFHYPVNRTGYYCAAVLPLSTSSDNVPSGGKSVLHPKFKGSILFQNVFRGHLPASDYPKIKLYFSLLLIYALIGFIWSITCYKYRVELLPIQYYLSSLVAFVTVQTLASWVYYRYLNSHGPGLMSTIFLFVVALLNAGRNSLSLFLLLIVSLGLSVVKESLGPLMTRCWLLTVVHFVFGVLYAVGIVELELESTSALVLLIFIVPLAFTLSIFLFWITFALNTTITQLQARKQFYKLGMFKRLFYILMSIVAMIVIFFVLSSLSFSNRLQQNYAAETWQTRWLLLDGYLALLYLVAFTGVTYIWRPTENNRRLAMSDELAQDENDAAEYDLSTMQLNPEDEGSDQHLGPSSPQMPVRHVVFDIGEDDPHETNEEHAMLQK